MMHFKMAHFTIETEKLTYGGDCIGEIGGKTVFVPFAIPGETLEIEITEDKGDFARAKINRIITSSPHRRESICPLYEKCGGCNMQHIDDDFQTELRVQVLKDAFERVGLNVPEIRAIQGKPFAYRSRFQFHNGGLKERGSDKIIKLEHCPVATDEINAYLLKKGEKKDGRVHVFGDSRVIGDEKVIEATETPRAKNEREVIGHSKRKIRLRENTHFSGTMASPENICAVNIAGKKIEFDARGFFQSNPEVLEKTIEKVTDNLSGDRVLDMYSGCGTFSVFLADSFNSVTLVEHNRDALVFAEKNLIGKKHESYGMSGEQFVKTQAPSILSRFGQFDAVVIDPPRSGMEKSVVDWLSKNKTHQIRAISCDPATQARDIAKLVKAGYTLTRLYLLDFYPQTCHIESLACLENLD